MPFRPLPYHPALTHMALAVGIHVDQHNRRAPRQLELQGWEPGKGREEARGAYVMPCGAQRDCPTSRSSCTSSLWTSCPSPFLHPFMATWRSGSTPYSQSYNIPCKGCPGGGMVTGRGRLLCGLAGGASVQHGAAPSAHTGRVVKRRLKVSACSWGLSATYSESQAHTAPHRAHRADTGPLKSTPTRPCSVSGAARAVEGEQGASVLGAMGDHTYPSCWGVGVLGWLCRTCGSVVLR
jgi:hypothetical protein